MPYVVDMTEPTRIYTAGWGIIESFRLGIKQK